MAVRARRQPQCRSRAARRSLHRKFGLPTIAVSVVALAAAALPFGVASAVSSPAFVRPGALAPPPLPADSLAVGAVPAGQVLSLDVVLAPSDPAKLQSLLDNLYDPSSPDYHHWLSKGAFAT